MPGAAGAVSVPSNSVPSTTSTMLPSPDVDSSTAPGIADARVAASASRPGAKRTIVWRLVEL